MIFQPKNINRSQAPPARVFCAEMASWRWDWMPLEKKKISKSPANGAHLTGGFVSRLIASKGWPMVWVPRGTPLRWTSDNFSQAPPSISNLIRQRKTLGELPKKDTVPVACKQQLQSIVSEFYDPTEAYTPTDRTRSYSRGIPRLGDCAETVKF